MLSMTGNKLHYEIHGDQGRRTGAVYILGKTTPNREPPPQKSHLQLGKPEEERKVENH